MKALGSTADIHSKVLGHRLRRARVLVDALVDGRVTAVEAQAAPAAFWDELSTRLALGHGPSPETLALVFFALEQRSGTA